MMTPFFPSSQTKETVAQSEEKILSYWRDHSIFKRSISSRSTQNPFVFFDGPPFATGTPHYGHILAGALKDAIPRYKTMRGYRVERKWGWDCHGVPVEFQVEKEHQIGGKPGIEAMGIGNFNELCRSVVLRCRDQWEDTVERMGRFVDFQDDYKTMDPKFMESVWWVFHQLWNKGLIYEGEKVVAYSPKLGSPLSNFEAGLNYKDIDDPTLTVKFKTTDKRVSLGEDVSVFFLAWTTTPWTLPSNLALGVHPDIQYVQTKPIDGLSYIVAENLLEKIFKDPIDIQRKIDGASLIGTAYTPLFPFFKNHKNAFRVIKGDFVSDTDGTGIVHLAPNFGEDDARVCQENDIAPLVSPIDQNGYFDDTIKELSGKYFRFDREVGEHTTDNANEWVIQYVKENHSLFHRAQIRHSYPHCWRTECALMYTGIKTWFVDIQSIKADLIDMNENIHWIPDYLKHGRFGKGLESAPDWAISRNRYWGTPIPVWKCDKTGVCQVIGSKAELERLSGKPVSDLHRHFIDDLTWTHPETGGTMRRIPEVLDCWFESGSMPYASQHYPFEPHHRFFKNRFVVIRHAQAENNVQEILSCTTQSAEKYGITSKGRKSVLDIRDRYKDIDIIFTSPFRRTRETAHLFAEISGAEIIEDERLQEVHFGIFDDKPSEEGHAYIDSHNIIDKPFPQGESIADCEKRVSDCIRDINNRYEGKNILIVSHGHPIQLIQSWNENRPAGPWENKIQNATPYELQSVFPAADFIAEGLDQTRCWFYNLHVLGVALFGKNIYKNVITNGIIQAEDGSKMSKSKKNYPDPSHIFNKYGADAMRFYLLNSPVARGENLRFSEYGVAEVLKSVILPLKSTYQFFSTYANLDEWKPTRIFAIRHAEAQHNTTGIYNGDIHTSSALTESGIKEAKELARTLSHASIDNIYTSPFERAKETAKLLSEVQKCDLHEDNRLSEMSFGSLEGKPFISAHDCILHADTEQLSHIQDRMASFWADIQKKHHGQTVAIVSHLAPIRCLQSHIHGISSHEEILRFPKLSTGDYTVLFPFPTPKNELDIWILSELQYVIDQFRTHFDAYKLESALKHIPEFIDKLNNWHLRRSRRRFWASGMNEDKQSGYETLHWVLLSLSKILAPVCPFLAEQLYRDLGGGDSVHLDSFPIPIKKAMKPDIEKKTNITRDIVRLAASIRARKKIKLRQPLSRLRFLVTEDIQLDFHIIAEEANVKKVETLTSLQGIAERIVRIQAKTAGPRLGKKVQAILQAGKEGRFEMQKDGSLLIEGEIIQPNEYEIGFVCSEGIEADSYQNMVVILDTDITHDLLLEGLARELIRYIQDTRKTQNFDLSDRITLTYHTQSKLLQECFHQFSSLIGQEVLAENIIKSDAIDDNMHDDTVLIDGEPIIISLQKNKL